MRDDTVIADHPSAIPPAHIAKQLELLIEQAVDFAIFLVDIDGRIVTWNEGARRILGYEASEVLGQTTHCLYTPDDVEQGIPERQLQIAREQGKAENERWQKKKDGALFYASGIDQAITDEAGNLCGFSIIFRDQTRQRQMQDTLRASEERYRRLVESIVDYAIFTLDAEGNVSDWNTGAQRVLGFRAEEVLGRPSATFFVPEDVARGIPEQEIQQAARAEWAEDERWHVRRDGSRFWASGLLMRMHDGEQHRYIKVMRDRTAGKQAEEERARQQAAIAVLQERNRLAQEIHDTLAQGFTGISLQLEAARGFLPDAPCQAGVHIERARTLAHESLQEARRSVQALRPALLQAQDLATALSRLTEQATADTAFTGEFHLQGTPRALPPAVEDELLRIGQEAVTNALRHSRGTRIRIELTFSPHAVQLWIQDNGQGFDVLAPVGGSHFGLLGMRERAQRLGGQLAVRSHAGQGTEIVVVVHTPARPES